jgi:hypothetical protein
MEVALYKEYLEKIYDLCAKCKSRVKFEITRQDGVLKQYLFQMGESGFLYEPKQKTYENQLKDNSNQERRQSSSYLNETKNFTIRLIKPFRSLSRLVAYILICLFTAIIVMYNKNEPSSIQETPTNSFWVLNEKCYLVEHALKYKSQFYDPIHKALQDKVKNFLLKNTNLMKLAMNDNDVIKETSFKYFNSKLPYNLIIIYFLCSFLIISSPRENRSRSLRFDFAIWLASLLMLIFNLQKCMKVFQLHGLFDSFSSNNNQSFTSAPMNIHPVSLDFVLLFAQVVFISVVFKIGDKIYKNFVKRRQLVSKTEEKTLQQQPKSSTGSNFDIQNFSNTTQYPALSFTKSAIRQSRPNESNIDQKLSNFSMDTQSQCNVIKPARFLLNSDAKSLFQFKTLKNGSASFLNGKI